MCRIFSSPNGRDWTQRDGGAFLITSFTTESGELVASGGHWRTRSKDGITWSHPERTESPVAPPTGFWFSDREEIEANGWVHGLQQSVAMSPASWSVTSRHLANGLTTSSVLYGDDTVWAIRNLHATPQGLFLIMNNSIWLAPWDLVIDSPHRLADGRVQLLIHGRPGQEVVLETAPTLAPAIWSPVTTNSIAYGGTLVSDTSATNAATRYYRAVAR